MPTFEILMPDNKRIDLTEQVKSAKSEKELKQALKDAIKTQHVVGTTSNTGEK
tara:strand:- start:2729 stop:2887 length:159 start_codon:yes stop_codon:yes gene_type:complete